MEQNHIEIPHKFLNIGNGCGQILVVLGGNIFSYGKEMPIKQLCGGNKRMLDSYIIGAISLYGVENVYAIYRAEGKPEISIENIRESGFSFGKLGDGEEKVSAYIKAN